MICDILKSESIVDTVRIVYIAIAVFCIYLKIRDTDKKAKK